jgi:phage major head subunit gpT-like protein
MPVDVGIFSAEARSEFMQGRIAAQDKPMPAEHSMFTTEYSSSTEVESHTYLSSIPRLKRFKGVEGATRLIDKTYTVTNFPYRIGPVTVNMDSVNDDQKGGYMAQIRALPAQAQKDLGYIALAHLAAGTTNLCFDGSAFFASSHTFGSGDNLDTANSAGSSDGTTHKIIALICDNPSMKPLLVQTREPVGALDTDADTPQARERREFRYWSDARFGLGYGFWWDAIHLTITDTPTVEDCYTHFEQILNLFRTFTAPKGKLTDDDIYIHEGFMPSKSNMVLLCNMKLGAILNRAMSISQYVSSTGNVDNVYKDAATVIPTSALGA